MKLLVLLILGFGSWVSANDGDRFFEQSVCRVFTYAGTTEHGRKLVGQFYLDSKGRLLTTTANEPTPRTVVGANLDLKSRMKDLHVNYSESTKYIAFWNLTEGHSFRLEFRLEEQAGNGACFNIFGHQELFNTQWREGTFHPPQGNANDLLDQILLMAIQQGILTKANIDVDFPELNQKLNASIVH